MSDKGIIGDEWRDLPPVDGEVAADGLKTSGEESAKTIAHEEGIAPPDTQEIADSRTQGDQATAEADAQTASGTCFGNLHLRPTGFVSIRGLTPAVNGEYELTEVVHRLSGGSFITEFKAKRTGG